MRTLFFARCFLSTKDPAGSMWMEDPPVHPRIPKPIASKRRSREGRRRAAQRETAAGRGRGQGVESGSFSFFKEKVVKECLLQNVTDTFGDILSQLSATFFRYAPFFPLEACTVCTNLAMFWLSGRTPDITGRQSVRSVKMPPGTCQRKHRIPQVSTLRSQF